MPGTVGLTYDGLMGDRTVPRARRRAAALGALLLVASLAATGCGGGEEQTSSASPSSGAVLPGGGLSVAEAMATDAEPPLAVTGWVVRNGGGARICSSYDPHAAKRCGEPSLALEGMVGGKTGEQVSLLGSIRGDTFVVTSTVIG